MVIETPPDVLGIIDDHWFKQEKLPHLSAVPEGQSAKDFWSFTLYDNQTRSMLQTGEQFPGIDNNKPGMIKNADGSYDVYFGPKALKGRENNWVQAISGARAGT